MENFNLNPWLIPPQELPLYFSAQLKVLVFYCIVQIISYILSYKKVCGGGGRGQESLNFPLPVPFNPSSRPIFVGSHVFALLPRCEILPMLCIFSLFLPLFCRLPFYPGLSPPVTPPQVWDEQNKNIVLQREELHRNIHLIFNLSTHFNLPFDNNNNNNNKKTKNKIKEKVFKQLSNSLQILL